MGKSEGMVIVCPTGDHMIRYGQNLDNSSASLKWRCQKVPTRTQMAQAALISRTWNWLHTAAPDHFQSCSSKARPWVQDLLCWKKPCCPLSWLFAIVTALLSFLLKPLCILSPIHPGHLHLTYLAPGPLLRLTRIILLSLVSPHACLLQHVSAKESSHCCSGKCNTDLFSSLQSQNLNLTDEDYF